MNRRHLIAVLLAAAGFLASPALAQTPTAQPVEGVAVGRELLIRDADGGIAAIDPAAGTRRQIAASGAVGLTRDGARAWLLIYPDGPPSPNKPASTRLRLTSYANGRIAPIAMEIPLKPGQVAVGMVVVNGRRLIVTNTGVNDVDAVKAPFTAYMGNAEVDGSALAATKDGQSIYVGANRGEWGGGLVRIDVATGKVTSIERIDDPKEICGYPLDTDCDPVTAIDADPDRPDCVYAGVGLQHMFSHGHVLRVCGGGIEVVFEKSVELPPPPPDKIRVGGTGTQAVYGLAVSDQDLLILTPEALHRLHEGRIETLAMPDLDQRAGLDFTDKLPGLYVLATGANRRHAVSGRTPLLIPRD